MLANCTLMFRYAFDYYYDQTVVSDERPRLYDLPQFMASEFPNLYFLIDLAITYKLSDRQISKTPATICKLFKQLTSRICLYQFHAMHNDLYILYLHIYIL